MTPTPYLAARPRSGAALRLFCFHHAGGGASVFAPWPRALPPEVEVLPVRLPGREARYREPRITTRRELLAELDAHLGPLLDQPYALYGHSLGALVAHAFAQHRAGAGAGANAVTNASTSNGASTSTSTSPGDGAPNPPLALLVGACRAPNRPIPVEVGPDLDDEVLVGTLRGLGGIPDEMLARPGWLGRVVAVFRDDLLLNQDLRAARPRPVPVPVHAFAGAADLLASPGEMAAWSAYTTAGFHPHLVAGGHFFQRDPDFLAALRGVVERLTPAGARGALAGVTVVE
ncbi:thioesterase II family protein [Allostreptomyces psammosilenae]|uniref:Surfactin synthase thioesterase subunit n=1 Tax=Allostreptomyces psammosilenae TaxID=1892865 RepID=A0A852ZZL1_9ACTN|nr:thioesterase [Allostreptomyces psammosilenae]NYI04021.1 surfactin synthase thioesterase subunit [Allostreptomyces psammosilenae]